jgi:hypothetical protein
MKLYKSLTILFTAVCLVFSSCTDFANLSVDPNRPTSAPASLVLNGVLRSITTGAWNSEMRWNQFFCINYNYYGTNEYWNGGASLEYTNLKNVVKMEEEATKAGGAAVNPYSALGKFFRAFMFVKMSSKVGDLPLTDALNGLDKTTPVYNTQKEIYIQALKWLDAANADLASLIAKGGQSADGDWYYGGDLTKWQKLVNTFTIRVLVSLSKKDADADLGIKAKFAAILADPAKYPLMTKNDDNFSYQPVSPFNLYPKNPSNYGFDALRENTSKVYIDLLKKFQDPRLFIVAEPVEAKIKKGANPLDFSSFEGASTGESLDIMSTKVQNGEYSLIGRKRYYSTNTGEPIIQVGYPELCFNIAEGINRGWAAGNAETYYKNGILASMSFYGIKTGANTVSFQKTGTSLGNFDNYTLNVDLDVYYNQAEVKYAGGAKGLEQILNQNYIAFAQNSDLEAYYNYRRTGIPVFLTGSGVGPTNQIPMRYRYPDAERRTNKSNLDAAVSSQFGGTDDLFGKMWLIK